MLRTSKQVRGNATLSNPSHLTLESPAPATEDAEPEPEAHLEVIVETSIFDVPPETENLEDSEADLAQALFDELTEAAHDIFTAAATDSVPDGDAVMDLIARTVDHLGRGEQLLSETVRQRKRDQSVPARSANSAILALRLGMELGYEKRRCVALGLCALMHDVGMQKMPPEITASSTLTNDQVETLRTHPTRSREIVENFGESFKWIGRIVAQVHERFDGSGYPRRLKGEQIHEFARILGLADTYEAMAHPRADRKARVIYQALKEIVDIDNALFDRRFVKALLDIVSIFPLGSLVKLNSGEIGRVVSTSKLHPTRPILEILVDPRGKRLEESHEYRLEEEPMLYIVDPGVEESVLHETN